jgi:mRNA interferase MazF
MMRGEIWWADFGIPFGSEPGFRRPVVVIQDNSFNKSDINTTIVIPLTTNIALAEAPGNLLFKKSVTKLSKESACVVSQIGVIDKDRLIEKIHKLDKEIILEIEIGIRLVLGFN